MNEISKSTRRRFLAQSAPLVGGMLGACALGVATAQPSLAPLRLGLPFPFTGRFASYGESVGPGVELAARLVNEAGGIRALRGARIEIVRGDTRGDPKVTGSVIERMKLDDKVDGIVGVFSSVESTSSAALADQYRMPFVSPTLISEKSYELRLRYARNLNLTATAYASGVLEFTKHLQSTRSLRVRRVALIYDGGEYGRSIVSVLKPGLQSAGLELVLDLPFTPPVTDFTPQVLRLKESGADILACGFFFPDSALFAKAMDVLGVHIPVVGFGGFADARLPGHLGQEVASRFLARNLVFNVVGVSEGVRYAPLQRLLNAAERQRLSFGDSPNALELNWFGLGAQAVFTFAAAFQAAADRDGTAVNEAMRRGLNLRHGDEQLIVPFYRPELAWDDVGRPLNQRALMMQWQAGKRVVVFPSEMAASEPRI